MTEQERQAALVRLHQLLAGYAFLQAELTGKSCDEVAKKIGRQAEPILSALQSPRVPDHHVVVPLEPTGPMIMYGIHAHEKNDDLPNIGLGPKCVGIYKSMIKGVSHE